MKTRTLLLLALGCGLAILLAGGALLVMLAGQDEPEPAVAIGEESAIGDMRVTVVAAEEPADADILTIDVVLGGVEDDDGSAGFELIASGRPIRPGESSTCGATTAEPRPCTLVFDVSTADGESRVLRYHRGDGRARWDVGAAGAQTTTDETTTDETTTDATTTDETTTDETTTDENGGDDTVNDDE
jgi:hypothetical protein